MDTLHLTIQKKHEADFVNSYKEHMLQVQAEMAEFRRNSTEYY